MGITQKTQDIAEELRRRYELDALPGKLDPGAPHKQVVRIQLPEGQRIYFGIHDQKWAGFKYAADGSFEGHLYLMGGPPASASRVAEQIAGAVKGGLLPETLDEIRELLILRNAGVTSDEEAIAKFTELLARYPKPEPKVVTKAGQNIFDKVEETE